MEDVVDSPCSHFSFAVETALVEKLYTDSVGFMTVVCLCWTNHSTPASLQPTFGTCSTDKADNATDESRHWHKHGALLTRNFCK